jgi:hypothetical protein
MRTLLIGALAATLVGCNCLLPPQAGMESCTDANRFACFDRAAASQPIEPEPALFKTNSATTEINSTIAAKTEKPSSARARDRAHLAMKTAKSTMILAKVERLQPASNAAADSETKRADIADSHPRGGAVANSNTRTTQRRWRPLLRCQRRNRKRIKPTVPVTRKPCCVAMPKRPQLDRQQPRPSVCPSHSSSGNQVGIRSNQ